MKRMRLFLCICMVHLVFSQTGTNLKDLHTYLFTTQAYNKNVRPATDQSVSTNVTLDLTITALVDLDEVLQKMITVGYLTIRWTDDFLQWTPSSYGNISMVEVPQGNIWKPDVHLSNGFTDFTELGGSFMQVQIDNTGSVKWMPYKVFETKCTLDILYFPFDTQTCKIQFLIWSTSMASVRLVLGTSGLTFDDLQPNGEWDIVSSSQISFVDDDDSFLAFYITLRRKPLLYILENLLPTIFLSILSIVTFVLPAESGERMSYSITIFLSFAVFLTIVSASLPNNSHTIPVFSIYLLLQLGVSVIVIIVSAVQLRFQFREESGPLPKYAIQITKWARQLQCKRGCLCSKKERNTQSVSPEIAVSDVDANEKEVKDSWKDKEEDRNSELCADISWKDVVSATDFFIAIFLIFVLFLFTIIIFGILLSQY